MTDIELLLENCKRVMASDGIDANEDTLPFINENNEVIYGGVFDIEALPLVENRVDDEIHYRVDSKTVNDLTCYQYDIHELCVNGLYDLIIEKFKDTVALTDLTSCDSLDLFDIALDNVTRFAEEKDRNNTGDFSYIYTELCDTLENLDPIVDNYWEIIVFLIDNGASYLKQEIELIDGEATVIYKADVSKTNLAYRLALEYTAQI